MNYLDKQDKRQDISNHSNNMIICIYKELKKRQ